MTDPDEATRRRIDAELRLQADPVLRECVEGLGILLAACTHPTIECTVAPPWRQVVAARALIAKLRGEQP